MSLLSRMFRRKQRAPSEPTVARAFPWPFHVIPGEPSWSARDLGVFAREGFNLNSLIYSAVMYKARAQQLAPLRVYTLTEDNPVPAPAGSRLASLLARPNEFQSWAEFQAVQTVFLNLTGNAYAYLDLERTKLVPLRPDWMYHVPGDEIGTLAGYVFTPDGVQMDRGVPLLPEEVVHVRFPNPLDPLGGAGPGLSPLSAAAFSADVDNIMNRFLREFFRSGAMPVGLLKFQTSLRREDVDEIRERWREKYGGAMNWLDVGVLDEGGEYQRVGLTFAEMGFEALDDRNESRVLSVLGVPAVLLGARVGLKNATYSNVQELRRVFWEDVFVPELRLFEVEYQNYLNDDEAGEFVAFDYSEVPALRQDVPSLVDAAYRLWTMGYPANMAAAAVGLSLPKISVGDISFLPMGVVPVGLPGGAGVSGGPGEPGAAPAPELEPGVQKALEELLRRSGQSGGATAPQTGGPFVGTTSKGRVEGWHATVGWAERDILPRMREVVTWWFEEQLAGVQRAFRTVGKSREPWVRKAVTIVELLAALDSAINAPLVDGSLGERFLPVLRLSLDDAAQEAIALGLRFDLDNVLSSEWFRDAPIRFALQPTETTEQVVREIIHYGDREGWSISRMQRALTSAFETWLGRGEPSADLDWIRDRLNPLRAEMIARTETMRAANAAKQQLGREAGIRQKEWVTALDGREREEHREADGQVVGIDEPFVVGGERLMYPGDPSGSAWNVINCRCTVAYVIPEEADLEAT